MDKCLPFGASISCSHFQKFSNAVAYIVCHRTGKEVINYLDDYLSAALLKLICNGQVDGFLQVCTTIRFPVALEKTFWGITRLVLLGMLLDTVAQTVSIPCDKVIKGKKLIQEIMCKRKITVKQLQKICGFLNFLCRCVVPGHAFVQRLYSFTTTKNSGNMKAHHHLRINQEMHDDLAMWSVFLEHPTTFTRPFMDFSKYWHADKIDFYSDASGRIGLGAVCQNDWMYGLWPQKFLNQQNPSIQYLELSVLTAAVWYWAHRFCNRCVIIFCDNQSMVGMINTYSSSCQNCMFLIRKLVLHCMTQNVRIFAKYIRSADNKFADFLSRGKLKEFRELSCGKYAESPMDIPSDIWPVEKIWIQQ